jgi:hypothetical protein
MTYGTTLPPIPDNAEYVVCPRCESIGWRRVGTVLYCLDHPETASVTLKEFAGEHDGHDTDCGRCHVARVLIDA